VLIHGALESARSLASVSFYSTTTRQVHYLSRNSCPRSWRRCKELRAGSVFLELLKSANVQVHRNFAVETHAM
jgi:hypothetical protein